MNSSDDLYRGLGVLLKANKSDIKHTIDCFIIFIHCALWNLGLRCSRVNGQPVARPSEDLPPDWNSIPHFYEFTYESDKDESKPAMEFKLVSLYRADVETLVVNLIRRQPQPDDLSSVSLPADLLPDYPACASLNSYNPDKLNQLKTSIQEKLLNPLIRLTRPDKSQPAAVRSYYVEPPYYAPPAPARSRQPYSRSDHPFAFPFGARFDPFDPFSPFSRQSNSNPPGFHRVANYPYGFPPAWD